MTLRVLIATRVTNLGIRRDRDLLAFSVLTLVSVISCYGCGMFGGNRGSSASGDIPPPAYSAEVIVNPDVLDFHATDGESLHSPPLMTDAEAPAYPYSAVRAGIEGRVLLNLVIGRSGMVVSVENSSAGANPLLVDAAVEAARKWEFAPARRDGAPIVCRAVVELMFNLSEAGNDAPAEIRDDNN